MHPAPLSDPAIISAGMSSQDSNIGDHLTIPQTDGNDTLSSENPRLLLTEDEIYDRDPELLSSGYVLEEASNSNQPTVPVSLESRALNLEPAPIPSHFVRDHSFTLNRDKQTASLAQDSNIEDFAIIVNDNDANVNIKCSSGFYASVARPAMSSFLQGTEFTIKECIIQCSHVAFNRDATGVEESRVLHLNLGNPDCPPHAKVTLTLHHTARLVQVQGGAKMYDGSKAALWFLSYYIKQKFEYEAKLKKYDISKVNKSINEKFSTRSSSLPSQGPKCSHCLKLFIANSIPVLCPFCLN